MSNLLLPLPAGNADGQINVDLASIGRTNKIYSEEEGAYIRNVLLAARQRKEELVDLIGRCEVALAPHKKLPPDVLRSIFPFSNETRAEFPLSKRIVALRLLHIIHVCSAWRQLALETPALWSNLGIYLTFVNRSRHHQALSSATQWFARAQDMPRSLFIRLDWLDDNEPYLRDVWEQILKFMALYRLRHLQLQYPIDRLTLKLPEHACSSIERLHLIGNEGIRRRAKSLFSHFGTLSNLKRLEICNTSNLRGLNNVIRWHQLRSLNIRASEHGEITPSLCLNALRQCQLLEHCSLSLSKESLFVYTVASGEEKIVLANMDQLHLKFFDGSAASAFLQPLVIPKITTFTLGTVSLEGPWTRLNCDMPTLIDIIQRSAGMRQIYCLDIDTSPLLDIGILLELLPSLERIYIESGYLTDNVIEQLSRGKLGPRLCSIYSGHVHDTADEILSMVESRYQKATNGGQIESGFCPFKSISIPCTTVDNERTNYYRCRVEFLSDECNADVWLAIGADEDSEED